MLPPPPPIRVLRRPVALLVLALFVGALVASMPRPAESAATGAVVGATVLSATSLSDTGCRTADALEFELPVSTFEIGDPCTLTFGSSNDTARLRIWQRDETGDALEQLDGPWTPRLGSTRWLAAAATSDGRAWVSGTGGPGEPALRFEHTQDGGATWTTQTPCTPHTPRHIRMFNDLDGWLSTPNAICRTTDGGATWTTAFPLSGITGFDMVSPTLGWVTAGNQVYRTVDGSSWTLVHTNATFALLVTISARPSGVVVINGRTSTVTTSDFGAVVSTDNGATWSTTVLHTKVGLDTSGGNGALAASDTILLTSAAYMGNWRSTDAGATWVPMALPGGIIIGEPFVRTDGAIFAAISGDSMWRSDDDGLTWTSTPLGTGQLASNQTVAGQGMDELWLAGHSDRRLHSTDGGATWQQVGATKPSFYAVVAWDANRYVVAGSGGAAVRTTNGGSTFDPVATGTTRLLHDGATRPHGVGVLVGDGVVLRTADAGASWNPIGVPSPSAWWRDVDVDDTGTLWAAGTSGRLMSSHDQGVTWSEHGSVPGAPTLHSLSVWRGTIWVGSTSGQVWRSTTATPSAWTAAPTGRTGTVIGVWGIDATSAVAVTEYEALANSSHASHTTDAGATWTSDPVIPHIRAIVVDDSHRYAWLATTGTMRRSVDLGATWEPPVSIGMGGYVYGGQTLGPARIIVAGQQNLVASRAPTYSFPDGLGGAGSGFGACLETAAGTLVNHWNLVGPGNCTTGAPVTSWQAIARTPLDPTAAVATTNTSDTATISLRFGVRTSASQRAGPYAAGIIIETIAPAT